ncbi:unnamed protein product, partial [Rotaria sp. Silwood2]
MTSAIV